MAYKPSMSDCLYLLTPLLSLILLHIFGTITLLDTLTYICQHFILANVILFTYIVLFKIHYALISPFCPLFSYFYYILNTLLIIKLCTNVVHGLFSVLTNFLLAEISLSYCMMVVYT